MNDVPYRPTDHEETLYQRLFSRPEFIPDLFRSWLVDYLEKSTLRLPVANLVGSGIVQTGMGVLWPSAVGVPDGFESADGTAISRTGFARLFDRIGTTYGVGDGSTTFNKPDWSGPDTNTIWLVKT